MRINIIYIGIALLVLLFGGSCNKTEGVASDPYAGGKEPLPVKFAESYPSPSEGRAGTEMTFTVYGIEEQYRDKMQFLINGLEAEITEVTDSTLSAILPKNVSTGGARLIIDGQIYPGPICQISGNVRLDPTFNAGAGSNGFISVIRMLNNNRILLGGNFTDYNGAAATTTIGGMVGISANGQYVPMSFGEGMEGGSITSIHQLNSNEILISGSIKNFNEVESINNITTLNLNGSLKTQDVDILNPTDDPEFNTLTVPVFNGGTNLPVMKTFAQGDKIMALGSFRSYNDYLYERSTYNGLLMGQYAVGGIMRLNFDGTYDDTFNIDNSLPPEQGQVRAPSRRGIEGIAADGFMQEDGKFIIVGRLSRYNNTPIVGNIVRINVDGSIDNTFNSGTGANEAISTIAETPDGKFLLTGLFSTYGGQPARGVVRLNADGSIDNSFQSKGFTGGLPTYVKQLINGKILVTGSFKHYDGIIREGLCILEQDGSLAEGYNNTGRLDGSITDALEGVNNSGQYTITLVGSILRFNGKSNIGNIMRLVFTE